MNRILVPIDGSKHATIAVKKAGKLAEKIGSNITLLYVIQSYAGPLLTFEPEFAPPNYIEFIDEITEKEAKSVLEKAKKLLSKKDVEPKTVIIRGTPADEIITYAKKEKIDLIVMGTRGLSGIKEFLIGSTSNKVIHHASCSVLLAKEKQ